MKNKFHRPFYVGVPGLEPGTPCSQSRYASQLRYTPNLFPFKELNLFKELTGAEREGFEPSIQV